MVMAQWRYVTPTTTGRWQASREAAEDAAVSAGYATRDAHPRPDGRRGRFYPHPLVRIEEQ